MLRRLVLAPAVAFLAIGTLTPASAGELCVNVEITEEFDLPGFLPPIPRRACLITPVEIPPLPPIPVPPIG